MLEVEITVMGQIPEYWSEWFDNLSIAHPQNDQTSLRGRVEDQASLHGLISRLWDLGLPIISIWTGPRKAPESTIFVNVRAIIEREISQEKEIVLQTRNKPHEGSKWLELPGGRVEPYESLVDALRREVYEETGLQLTHIEGMNNRTQSCSDDTCVECLPSFAVYQTLCGPVDSLGIYFRCQAAGDLLCGGDATESIQWVKVAQIAQWLQHEMDCAQPTVGTGGLRFSWVDRSGLIFYLHNLKRTA